MKRPSLVLLTGLTVAIGCGEAPTGNCFGGCPGPSGPTTGSLMGTVMTAVGTPVVGALVTTSPATRAALTDATGRFVILDLEPGPYAVVAAKEGFVAAATTVTVAAGGAHTPALTLGDPPPNAPNGQAVLFVLVLGPDGAPRPGVEVEFRKLNQIDTARATTDPEGLAVLGPASIGTYEVVASAEIGGHPFQARTVMQARIREGTTATLQLRRVF